MCAMERSKGSEPLYVRVYRELERMALTAEIDDETPLPAEPDLVRTLGVSRGTLRRATEQLVREGLLRAEPGRGTYINRTERVRRVIWDRLVKVARPDSRFDLDLTKFIPDFEGSESCDRAIVRLPSYKAAAIVFMTPDNSLERLRSSALSAGKRLVVPTFGARRGFVLLDGANLRASTADLAATLDGMERHGTRLDVAGLRELGSVDMIISGAVAVSRGGLHVGGGRGMLDLEWGVVRELRLATDDTPVAVSVHECQVIAESLPAGASDCTADFVVTPSEVIRCSPHLPRPAGILWDLLTADDFDSYPFLRALA